MIQWKRRGSLHTDILQAPKRLIRTHFNQQGSTMACCSYAKIYAAMTILSATIPHTENSSQTGKLALTS